MASQKKGIVVKWFLAPLLLLLELLTLLVMEAYKYYANGGSDAGFRVFLRQLIHNFDITYTGNLIWLILFLISLASLINIFRCSEKVSVPALRSVLIIYLFSLFILVLAVSIPSTEAIDDFTSGILQLGTKGTKTLLLSFFSVLKIFISISFAVIGFSALKKYYVFRSIWLTILTIVITFSLLLISVYYYKDDYDILMNEKKSYDAGIILGAAVWGGNRPSPVLRERINKGYELYKNGIVGYLVLTGGGSPGEMTEAEVAKNELLKKGIDGKNVFAENQSNSTLEQVSFISKNLYRKNNWTEIVLITDNFHLLRSKQMCKFFGMNASTVASDTPLSTESTFSFSLKESFALILFWLFGIG